jgi:ABC-type branched-subunit amino acid transport system substrate-binding protein
MAAVALLCTIAAGACSVHTSSGAGAIIPPDRAVKTSSATDRGLTATTITIGAIVYKDDSYAQFGLNSLGGKPVDRVIQPFVDDINEHGGIDGRRVVLAVSRFSPIVPADQETACIDQADDKKVFATIATAGFTADGERCLASRGTPVITSNLSSEASLKADDGWVRQTSMSKDRIIRNWVDWLVRSGTAGPSTRIGVIHADDPEDNALVTGVLIPSLERDGRRVVAQAAFTGTTVDTVTSQAENAAQKFKDAGVNLVLPDLDFLRTYAFLGAGNNAGLKSRYSVSDLGQLSLDAATNFFPSSFNGTEGVTAYVTGISGPGRVPATPAFDQCLDIYRAHGQQLSADPVGRLAEELELAQFCEHLNLIAQAAKLAGPHLNRATFLDAFSRLGTWSDRVTLTGPLTFGPSKFDGPDDYAVIQWQSNCGQGTVSCYRQVAPLEKGRW